MKTLATFFSAPLVITVTLSVVVVSMVAEESTHLWTWCLAVMVALIVAVPVAGLLNISVLAPVYWLWGKLQSGSARRRAHHGDET